MHFIKAGWTLIRHFVMKTGQVLPKSTSLGLFNPFLPTIRQPKSVITLSSHLFLLTIYNKQFGTMETEQQHCCTFHHLFKIR